MGKLCHLVAKIVTKIFDREIQMACYGKMCFRVLGASGATVDVPLAAEV